MQNDYAWGKSLVELRTVVMAAQTRLLPPQSSILGWRGAIMFGVAPPASVVFLCSCVRARGERRAVNMFEGLMPHLAIYRQPQAISISDKVVASKRLNSRRTRASDGVAIFKNNLDPELESSSPPRRSL